jgi:PadR family transcriptional regulator, regulatory protein PadR
MLLELKKGSLNLLVLQMLFERPSYGWEICQRLRERSDGALTFEDSAIYPLLHAFERDGLAEGYWEAKQAGEAMRKGARRRYYRLTAQGVAALRNALADWRTFTQAVGQIVDDQALAGEGQA